jgi:hypothetical protein
VVEEHAAWKDFEIGVFVFIGGKPTVAAWHIDSMMKTIFRFV